MLAYLVAFVILQAIILLHVGVMALTGWLFGLHVQEVALGNGPELFGWAIGGIRFKVNLLPIGGYSKFLGVKDDDDPLVGLESNITSYSELHPLLKVVHNLSGCLVLLLAASAAVAIPVGFESPASIVDLAPDNQRHALALGEYTVGEAIDSIPTFAASQVFSSSHPAPLRQIATLAGDTPVAWLTFFSLLAFIFAAYNLVPIPLLNGGFALMFMIEWIRGRQFSERFYMQAGNIGIVLCLVMFPLFWWRLLRG